MIERDASFIAVEKINVALKLLKNADNEDKVRDIIHSLSVDYFSDDELSSTQRAIKDLKAIGEDDIADSLLSDLAAEIDEIEADNLWY